MRIVTKDELLKLEPPVIFRKWVPCAYDDYDWEIKAGNDFGAVILSPDASNFFPAEEVWETYDWDGNIDIDDNETFAVLEEKDIQLMIARLQACLENKENDMSKFGADISLYSDLKTKYPKIKFKGW